MEEKIGKIVDYSEDFTLRDWLVPFIAIVVTFSAAALSELILSMPWVNPMYWGLLILVWIILAQYRAHARLKRLYLELKTGRVKPEGDATFDIEGLRQALDASLEAMRVQNTEIKNRLDSDSHWVAARTSAIREIVRQFRRGAELQSSTLSCLDHTSEYSSRQPGP